MTGSRPDREHILSEIRRVADAFGGAAPGRKRFEAETGIRESDWCGVYFVRWSDAVAEAGLEPNELQKASHRDDLVDLLLSIAERLGRVPTYAELDLEHRRDPSVPTSGTFQSRLGTIHERAKWISEYLERHPERREVAQLFFQQASSTESRPTESARRSSVQLEWGAVYLMRSGKYHKIGRSNSAGRRHAELKTQLPEKLELVHEISTDDPVGIEQYWHSRFGSKRANGEWFDLSSADVAAFKRRKFM
ncbi:MAG: GIY-YIG nuclease family protein [Planctomycetota bacterium]